MRPHRTILAALLTAAFSLSLSCRLDPVPQDRVDELPEETGEPSEFHRPGQPCAVCHNEYEGADPMLAIGGTVFEQNPETFQLMAIEGVFVTIYDSAGASQKACTNATGNFFVRMVDWPDAKFPLTVQVGNRFMRSLVGRDRSCATCHTLATPSRVENDPTVDSSTGAGRDSAGAILVDRAAVPPEEQCGANPASAASSSATGGGMGGAGGAGGGGS